MPISSRAAAWNRGPRSDSARSCQWNESVELVAQVVAFDIDLAIKSAPSHVVEQSIGDQDIESTIRGVATVPVGSKTTHLPDLARFCQVSSIISVLVDVATTGPLASNRVGTIIDDVFPDRGGPSTNIASSGLDQCQPFTDFPR